MSLMIEDSDLAELRCLLQEKDERISELEELVVEFVEAYRHCLQFKGADIELFERAKEAVGK